MEKSELTKKNIAAMVTAFLFYGMATGGNEFRVMFMQEQGMSAAECGYVLASAGILQALVRPLSGIIADKLRSRKWVFIISGITWIVLLALLLLFGAGRIGTFVLCAGLFPLLNACDLVSGGMLEADAVEMSRRKEKLDFSLLRISLSVGYSLVNFMYTPLVNRFGVTAPYICTIVFVGIGLIVGRGLKCVEGSKQENAVREKLEVGRILKNYYLITYVVLMFLLTMATNTSSYLIYLLQELGIDSSLIGLANGIRVAGEIIIMPLIPLLKRKISLPLMPVIAAAVMMIQVIMFVLCRNPVIVMCTFLLYGISVGMILGTVLVYMRQMAPEGLENTTLSLYSVTVGCAGVAMSFLGGIIVDSLGVITLYVIALVILVGFILLYFFLWFFGKKVLKIKPPVEMFRSR